LVKKWTEDEIEILREHFKEHIAEERAPKKNEVVSFMEIASHSRIFQTRKWDTIKVAVCNQFKKKNKL
jgi:hypothetical protein